MRGLVLLASAFIAVCGLWVQPAAANDKEHCIYSSKAANTKASIEACTRLISSGRFRDQELVELYVSRMRSLYTENLYDQAVADANEIILKLLRQPAQQKITRTPLRDAYYYRGNTHYWTKQYDKAISDLNTLIRDFPNDQNAIHTRGQAYLAKNDLDTAIADFDETIRLDPQYRLGYSDRALAYEKKNNLPKALSDARRASEIEQGKGYTAFRELEVVKRIEQKMAASGARVPPAETVAAAAAPNAPARPAPAATNERDHCIYSSKAANTKASIEACTRLISSGRFSGEELIKLYESRMDSLHSESIYDRSIADANEIITKLLPQPAQAKITNEFLKRAYYVRGSSHYWSKQPAKAIPDLTAVIRDFPNDYNALYLRGVSYLAVNNFVSAIADLDETLRIDPTHSLVHKNRATAYEQTNDLSRALVDARHVLKTEQTKGYSGSSELEIVKRIEQKIAAGGGRVPPQVLATPAPSPPAPQPTQPVAAPAPAPVVAAVPQATPPKPAPVVAAIPQAAPPKPAPAPAVTTTPTGPRIALVIGNGKYRHATQLTNPANDAADIAALLRKLGFDVVEGRDLDKRGMEDKVREFGRKLDRAELALFFYAGHGMQVAGKNYLVPVDSKLERPGDLNFDTIDVSFILAQMEADQRVNLIFLDACRDNPLARSFARSLGTRSTAVGQGLASIQGALGTMIGYATQPDAVALDGEGRNSPFTTAMIKHLATPGLEIATLMRRVRADVVAATRGKQVPWDHSSLVVDVVLSR